MMLLLPGARVGGTSTATTLSVTAGGSAVTTVATGTVVTLTAAVKAGNTGITLRGASAFTRGSAYFPATGRERAV